MKLLVLLLVAAIVANDMVSAMPHAMLVDSCGSHNKIKSAKDALRFLIAESTDDDQENKEMENVEGATRFILEMPVSNNDTAGPGDVVETEQNDVESTDEEAASIETSSASNSDSEV